MRMFFLLILLLVAFLYMRRKTIGYDIIFFILNIISVYYYIVGMPKYTPPTYEGEIAKPDLLRGFKVPSLRYFAFQSLLRSIQIKSPHLHKLRNMTANSGISGRVLDKCKSISAANTPKKTRYIHVVSEEVTQGDRAVIYIHGGGYCVGNASTYLGFAAALGKYTRSEVFMLDYEPVPEHSITQQLESSVDLFIHLSKTKMSIVLIGDSAGGGLVYATLQRLKEISPTMPVAACLVSPWLNIKLSGESNTINRDRDAILTPGIMAVFQKSLVQRHQSLDAVEEALYTGHSLEGLPPLLVIASKEEILFSDSSDLVLKARKDGCEVLFESIPYGAHAYTSFMFFVPEYRESFYNICAFLRKHMGIPG